MDSKMIKNQIILIYSFQYKSNNKQEQKNNILIFGVTSIILISSVIGILKLEVENSFINYFQYIIIYGQYDNNDKGEKNEQSRIFDKGGEFEQKLQSVQIQPKFGMDVRFMYAIFEQ